MMKKILLPGACAGLLALSAVPVLAAGPMISGTSNHAVQNVEYRWNQWQGRQTWNNNWQRPHYYAPRYGYGAWGNHHYSPWYGRSNWGNYHHVPPGQWRHQHQGYWWHR
ncbi:MAG: hypothetical protein JO055_07925 [Alphaproteobacteria bacterium]|nr:hypothetical protein [Alphaproteobacteria bacterium]